MKFLLKGKRTIATLCTTAMLLSMLSVGAMALEIDYSVDGDYTDYTESAFDYAPVYEEDASADYYYGYAPMTFAEFWAGELDGDVDAFAVESSELDSEGYTDAGMYDAVSRATVKHGIYRMQISYIVDVYGVDEDGNGVIVTASAAYTGDLDEDGEFILENDVDGALEIGDTSSTFEYEGTTYTITGYNTLGYKSIPVAVSADQIDSVAGFVESDEVDADTYGLKTLGEDGIFGARDVSGSTGNVLVADYENLTYVYDTGYGSDAEVYFYLMNEDGSEMTDEELLAYLPTFLTARLDYYGDDSTYTTLVGSYGTKVASDTWWSDHHGNRVDIGINYGFDRFEGSGTGYYEVTLISSEYDDVTAQICFLSAYPAEVSATLDGNTLTISGANVADLVGETVTITSGSKPSTTHVDAVELTGDTMAFDDFTAEAGTTYSIAITQTNYQPISLSYTPATWYDEALAWAEENGITTDIAFDAEVACTRAQAVTFMWNAAGAPEIEGENAFTDVSADAYYYDAVLWAVSEGITTGTSATTFSPDGVCSRGQIATFLYRAAGEPAMGEENPFADVTDGDYFYDAVLWAVDEGITNGTSDTAFSPDDDCTCAHILTFLYRSQA